MGTYRAVQEVMVGDAIYLASTSTTPSIVTEVRESAHGLANAHGATVFEVQTFITEWNGFGPTRPFTAWPNTTYRLETDMAGWLS